MYWTGCAEVGWDGAGWVQAPIVALVTGEDDGQERVARSALSVTLAEESAGKWGRVQIMLRVVQKRIRVTNPSRSAPASLRA